MLKPRVERGRIYPVSLNFSKIILFDLVYFFLSAEIDKHQGQETLLCNGFAWCPGNREEIGHK